MTTISWIVVDLTAYAILQKLKLHLLDSGRVVHNLNHLVVARLALLGLLLTIVGQSLKLRT